MNFFELQSADLVPISASDLRELVARLCEAELLQQGFPAKSVSWGGAQEAPDGGLDVRVDEDRLPPSNDFLPRGSTGYQVKKHKMAPAACKAEMLDGNTPKQVILDLAKSGGAYVIVSGGDDCSDSMLSSRVSAMKAALGSIDGAAGIYLDFFGRDKLATWLRRHPSVAIWLRFRLGKSLAGWKPHGRWAGTPATQDDAFLMDEHPCVTDRSSRGEAPLKVVEGLELVRDRLRARGKSLRITGLSGVGKTRFVQALFDPEIGDRALNPAKVIYADLGEDLKPSATELLDYLVANDHDVILVLDNCPPDVHRRLQKRVVDSGARMRLLTIEYEISDDHPEETDVVQLEPCGEERVAMLVERRFPDLGKINASRIADFSGGNARVALALASRVYADETLTNFSDEDLFRRLFEQRKGAPESLYRSAETLSLVYSFNVSEDNGDELSGLARIAGCSRHDLYRDQAELLRRQLAQQRGDWRAILPHALANRLARRALENISVTDLNRELLRPENTRLLRSCARRIGYLHHFEPAAKLAATWIEQGGPLHDLVDLDDTKVQALRQIAPVLPGEVLRLIEQASADPSFASRANPRFSAIVGLLSQLAYDDDKFDRALDLMANFARGEDANEKIDNIVDRMAQLFSLFLSGTHASPQRRRAYIEKLINSHDVRSIEIGRRLLKSALSTEHWVSFAQFEFGARVRDSGWSPKSLDDQADWYQNLISFLRPGLDDPHHPLRTWATEALAENFRGLWSFAGCSEPLDELVRLHIKGGVAPEIWIAIRRTIDMDGEDLPESQLLALQTLEALTAPSDLPSQMRAYLLCDIWDLVGTSLDEGSYGEMEKKIEALGRSVAAEPSHLEALGNKLWESRSDALVAFGRGLAQTSAKSRALFERLVEMAERSAPLDTAPLLLGGFIAAVHERDPALARVFQEEALVPPALKPHSIYLLTLWSPQPWAVIKLIELAQNNDFEVSAFNRLGYWRLHESIPDDSLAALLRILIAKKDGFGVCLQILRMRFHSQEAKGVAPGTALLEAGREAILVMLKDAERPFGSAFLNGTNQVIDHCLSSITPLDYINRLIGLMCEAIDSYRVHSHDIEHVIRTLSSRFTENLLDYVVADPRKDRLIFSLFRDRIGHIGPSLSCAPTERVVAWCRDHPEHFSSVLSAVRVYVPSEGRQAPLELPRIVVISSHARALLDIAPDPDAAVEAMFKALRPISWSGSLADIVDLRLKAFRTLLNHPDDRVRAAAAPSVARAEAMSISLRKSESAENHEREQRFE